MISSFEFSGNVVGVMIDSNIDEELMEKVHKEISEKLKEHVKINLFFEIRGGNKMSVIAFINELGYNLRHTKSFNKLAMVTDLEWMKNAMIFKDIIMATDIRTFSNDQRLKALNWIVE